MGNMRPLPLQIAEKELWKLLMNGAAGHDRSNELAKYFDNVSDALEANESELQRDWFLKGSSFIICLLHQLKYIPQRAKVHTKAH